MAGESVENGEDPAMAVSQATTSVESQPRLLAQLKKTREQIRVRHSAHREKFLAAHKQHMAKRQALKQARKEKLAEHEKQWQQKIDTVKEKMKLKHHAHAGAKTHHASKKVNHAHQ